LISKGFVLFAVVATPIDRTYTGFSFVPYQTDTD
jgi:hypothetical protein